MEKIKDKFKKVLLKKLKGDGEVSILIGSSILLMFSMFIYVENIYNRNMITGNFVEDGITTSLLGATLAGIDEYGASNQLIIYDMIDNHSNSDDDKYIDYIDGIEFTDGTYYSTYIFDDVTDIDTLGNLDESASGRFGPEQSYNTFLKLLKTNLRLDNSLVPIDDLYLPSTKNGTDPNIVDISDFTVYNYIEFLVKSEDFDDTTILTKPLLNINGDVVNTCDNTGDPLFDSYEDLVNNNLIHTKVICFDIHDGYITDSVVYDTNEIVYAKDSSGNKVVGEDGNFIIIDSSGIYTKINMYVNLGKEHLSDSDNYTLVSRDKMVFIEHDK